MNNKLKKLIGADERPYNVSYHVLERVKSGRHQNRMTRFLKFSYSINKVIKMK